MDAVLEMAEAAKVEVAEAVEAEVAAVTDSANTVVVLAGETGDQEASITPDFGQSTPEDEDTYPSRR